MTSVDKLILGAGSLIEYHIEVVAFTGIVVEPMAMYRGLLRLAALLLPGFDGYGRRCPASVDPNRCSGDAPNSRPC